MKYEPKLSKEDAMELLVEYEKTRDQEIRNRLIENYLYIPKILSRKYGHRNGDNDDIFQVACLGLMYALDRFDPDRGYAFDTFATPTIIGEIKRRYRDREYLIRIPRKIQELNQKVDQTRRILEQKYMRSPTISEIAIQLEISEEIIIQSIESTNAYYPKSISMEFDNQDGNSVSLADLLGTTDTNIENVENIDVIKKIIEEMTPLEKIVIEQRFLRQKTQKEVALFIMKSQMTVSRLEKVIMEKLRESF